MIFIFLVVIVVGFYFLLIRPQRKRQSDHKNMILELQTGDKVITIGGIYGEIDSIDTHDLILIIEDGNKLKLLKSSIMGKQRAEEIEEEEVDEEEIEAEEIEEEEVDEEEIKQIE